MQSYTVLFTWEIGQGFGHVLPLLPIARELKAKGHRAIFALRDVREAGALLKKEGFHVLQAPAHPDQFFPARGPQPQTMADILKVFGFTSKQSLSGLVAAWQDLFALCKPDVLIASYAPLSLLCARHAGIPSMLMALPFELPAAVHPSPPLRTGGPLSDGLVDAQIVNAVNTVFPAGFVENVHEIFRADKALLMSFEELDAFTPRSNVEYCGNLFVTDIGPDPIWPKGPFQHKVFVYLNTSLPDLPALREQLHASPHAYCVVLRNADEGMILEWQSPNMSATSLPISLSQALKDCDVVLSYGGPGFISAALLAGKPMVFYCRNLESYLNAKQVAKLGAGIHPNPQTPAKVVAGLNTVVGDNAFIKAAQIFARKYGKHEPRTTASQIVATALHLCQRSTR